MTWFSKEQMRQLKELLDAEFTQLESHMNREFDKINEQIRNMNKCLDKINEQLTGYRDPLPAAYQEES